MAGRMEPLLGAQERQAITGGTWFAGLSPALRHDLLRVLVVRRHAHGDLIAARGEPVREWLACAAGAVRVASTGADDRQLTLTFVRPGRWFGDPPLAAGEVRSHDAYAHGATTTAAVRQQDLQRILAQHPELGPALARLQSLRLRQVFNLVEDMARLGLRRRLARQLLYLMRAHGEPCRGGEVRIALRLRQDVLAELLGCSRQRVNGELAVLAQADVIRKERSAVVVRSRERLEALVAGAGGVLRLQ